MIKSIQVDVEIIQRDLAEPGDIYGAYYQDYECFREIYRFVARGISRSGQTVYTLLFTLLTPQGDVPDSEQLEPAMEELRELIIHMLRRGDLFAKYSSAQYIVMLPGTAYEDSGGVIDRIKKAYEPMSIANQLVLYCSYAPITPAK